MNAQRTQELERFLKAARTHPQLIGILNVTPDSFSDGGRYGDMASVIAAACAMHAAGATAIDIGGESTRPGAMPVSAEEEAQRIAGVVASLRAALPDEAVLSIDTYRASTAAIALREGAHIVNDVWGLTKDLTIANLVAEMGGGLILMHNRDQIDATVDIMADIEAFFQRQITLAQSAGVPAEHIILDPGIGFGKTQAQNYDVLQNLERLKRFEHSILVGVSRKSLIGHVTGAPVDHRLAGTLAAGLVSVQKGASILRVHDVAEHRQALAILGAIEGKRV